MRTKNREIKTIFAVVVIVFGVFLAYPMIRLLLKSFIGDTGATTAFYHAVLTEKGIAQAIVNSFKVAGASALLTTMLAFSWPIRCIIPMHRDGSKSHSCGCGAADVSADTRLWRKVCK